MAKWIAQKFDEIKANSSKLTGDVGRILSWFGSLPGKFASWLDRVRQVCRAEVRCRRELCAGHSGQDPLGPRQPGSLLFSSGQHLLLGLLHGIESMVGTVVSAAENVGSSILSGIKSALGIGSPSRITYQHGRWLAEGLINGMDSMHGPVSAAASRLAGGAIPARYGTGDGRPGAAAARSR